MRKRVSHLLIPCILWEFLLKFDDIYSPMWNEMSDRLQIQPHNHPETIMLPSRVTSAIQGAKATRPTTWFPDLEDLTFLALGHSQLIRACTEEEPRDFQFMST